jgi:uncharacterized protein YndB with AHSA1/START domain
VTSITIVRRIRAQPSVVYAALISSEGIAHWWGPDAGPVLVSESDGRVGGRFRVRFRTGDGTEHESIGEFLELIDSRRVVLSWEWAHGGEPDERGQVSRVVFELRPIDVGTELTFTHARLATPVSASSHEGGWQGAFDKLDVYLAARTAAAAPG